MQDEEHQIEVPKKGKEAGGCGYPGRRPSLCSALPRAIILPPSSGLRPPSPTGSWRTAIEAEPDGKGAPHPACGHPLPQGEGPLAGRPSIWGRRELHPYREGIGAEQSKGIPSSGLRPPSPTGSWRTAIRGQGSGGRGQEPMGRGPLTWPAATLSRRARGPGGLP